MEDEDEPEELRSKRAVVFVSDEAEESGRGLETSGSGESGEKNGNGSGRSATVVGSSSGGLQVLSP